MFPYTDKISTVITAFPHFMNTNCLIYLQFQEISNKVYANI